MDTIDLLEMRLRDKDAVESHLSMMSNEGYASSCRLGTQIGALGPVIIYFLLSGI